MKTSRILLTIAAALSLAATTAWADELAAWKRPDAWDQLQLGLRYGSDPRCCVTTTPRPTRVIRDLIAHPLTQVVRGSTYENAGNLPPAWLQQILEKYEGTTIGRQELEAQVLDESPGALWQRTEGIEAHRLSSIEIEQLTRIVVAIDPAVTSSEGSDDTGIIVAGRDARGHGYILEDLTCHESPRRWAQIAAQAYDRWQADRIIGEANNGGDMIEEVIRTVAPQVAYTKVHASRGKAARAEPIASLAEQGKVHHVGHLGALEDELCNWVPNSGQRSPNRLDALVWALTELLLDGGASAPILMDTSPLATEAWQII